MAHHFHLWLLTIHPDIIFSSGMGFFCFNCNKKVRGAPVKHPCTKRGGKRLEASILAGKATHKACKQRGLPCTCQVCKRFAKSSITKSANNVNGQSRPTVASSMLNPLLATNLHPVASTQAAASSKTVSPRQPDAIVAAWTCAICTYNNFGARPSCAECDEPNPGGFNIAELTESRLCIICGCSRETDSFGDRVCWCDACQASGCQTASSAILRQTVVLTAEVVPVV